jgi:hypothetical protein
MSLVSPAQAEEALVHLTHHFAQWRQSRTTPRGRIPKSLWAQAVTLAQLLPCTRVAKHLGLTPQVLKRRRDALPRMSALTPFSQPPPFVEVAAPWRSPTAEVKTGKETAPAQRASSAAGSRMKNRRKVKQSHRRNTLLWAMSICGKTDTMSRPSPSYRRP